MELLILIISSWIMVGMSDNHLNPEPLTNSSDPDKDMYVIHAMVYQIGIITNKSDEEMDNSTLGNQEAVTFYHSNGTSIDLNNIPTPLATNVTAQRLVGVAPALDVTTNPQNQLPWTSLEHLASLQQPQPSADSLKEPNGKPEASRNIRDTDHGALQTPDLYNTNYSKIFLPNSQKNHKRSSEGNDDTNTVKVVKGDAVIPQEVGVQSLAIPPLLSLNNNFSEIPVPIPNTSVVHYAKVNTLVRRP